MELSIILPVYNESDRLADCVSRLERYLIKNFRAFEIIIVEDNSTDGSLVVAESISSADKNIVLIHNDDRLGRGASLVEAIKMARGEFVAYMDVDLATDIGHTKKLVEGLRGGASVTTGSRLMKDSDVKRPLLRDVISKAYNLLVRTLFRSKVHDHQCGFKGFRKKDIIRVLDHIHDDHWFWDTELLVICQKLGLIVYEFPVKWRHNGGNGLRASKVKVLKDSYVMGIKLLELKWRLLTHDISL